MNKFDYCEFLSEQGVYEFLKKIGDLKKIILVGLNYSKNYLCFENKPLTTAYETCIYYLTKIVMNHHIIEKKLCSALWQKEFNASSPLNLSTEEAEELQQILNASQYMEDKVIENFKKGDYTSVIIWVSDRLYQYTYSNVSYYFYLKGKSRGFQDSREVFANTFSNLIAEYGQFIDTEYIIRNNSCIVEEEDYDEGFDDLEESLNKKTLWKYNNLLE